MVADRFVGVHVLGLPQPQGSMKAYTNRATGRPIILDSNDKLKDWRMRVEVEARRVEAEEHFRVPGKASYRLWVLFQFPEPKSKHCVHKNTRPDLDKLIRAVCDALTDILLDDDAEIVEMVGAKEWGSKAPGVWIYLTRLDPERTEKELRLPGM